MPLRAFQPEEEGIEANGLSLVLQGAGGEPGMGHAKQVDQ